MDAVLEAIKQFPIEKAIFTVCLSAVCLLLLKIILVVLDKALNRSKLDKLACKIVRTIIKAFLLFTAVIIVLGSLGISVTSLIAMLSVVGVAFSLAIQGFLSNVFGGIQIISNHPFSVGDYVEAGGEGGTVREVGLFYTKLDTPDKKLIQIPNSKIANENIINYSTAPHRRLEFLFGVSYDCEVEKVQAIVLELLKSHPLVLTEGGMAPAVHVKEYRDNDVYYTARAWCENKDYWTIYFDIMDTLMPTFTNNGIHFTYPHVNVHMVTK